LLDCVSPAAPSKIKLATRHHETDSPAAFATAPAREQWRSDLLFLLCLFRWCRNRSGHDAGTTLVLEPVASVDLAQAPPELLASVTLGLGVDGFELAAIDRDEARVQEIDVAAERDELLASLSPSPLGSQKQ
jgi:hypothetical protein